MKKEHFINRLMEIAEIDCKHKAERGLHVVFSMLSHRLMPEEAKDVKAQLPEDMKGLWDSQTWATYYAGLSNKRLMYRHMKEMLSLVDNELRRENLGINAEHLTKAVFQLLKEQISCGEVKDITAQLPEEISEYFKAA